MRRPRALLGIVVVIAFGVGAFLVANRDDGSSRSRSAASQIARFTASTTPTSTPDAVQRREFAAAFAHLSASAGSVDLTRLRRFTLKAPTRFSIIAAPTSTGQICYQNVSGGAGTCLEAFVNGEGMTQGYRQIGGSKQNVITGLLPDGITRVEFTTLRGTYDTPVSENLFLFRIPVADGTHVRSYTLIGADGSRRTEPYSV